LQNYNHSGTSLQFYVFDLLSLRGRNLLDQPLDERRELLRSQIMPRMSGEILSESLEASAVEVAATVNCEFQAFRDCRPFIFWFEDSDWRPVLSVLSR
jgi:ATP-dependent DNA ligase